MSSEKSRLRLFWPSRAAFTSKKDCMTLGPRVRVIAALAALFYAPSVEPAELLVDKAAPDFQVTTLDGEKLTLADFKFEVLVINFWATWCGPCKTELPMLDAYYRQQQYSGLRILAVTTEDSLPISKLKPLAAVLTIPMARHFKGPYGPMRGVPTNFVIDRHGVLRYAKAGALTFDDMQSVLAPLLKEDVAAHKLETSSALGDQQSGVGSKLNAAEQIALRAGR
jgi:cytochrome c biogenesis protein CcmG/thiol:disulfide interchange protein DsbE